MHTKTAVANAWVATVRNGRCAAPSWAGAHTAWASEPTPEAPGGQVSEFGAQVWALALEMANAGLAAQREALEQTRTRIDTEKAEAAELADQVAADLEDTRATLSGTEAALKAARQDIDSLRTQAEAARLQAATAEARASEIERRAADLNAQLERVNRQNSELLAALSAAKATPRARGKS